MKIIPLEADTLESILRLARYGLAHHQDRLDRLAPPSNVSDRNEQIALRAEVNRGMRALNKVETKVIFS
jgi:hypothetical protein